MSETATAEEVPDDPDDVVLEELRRLRAAFDSKIRYDEVQEQRVQAMAKELEELRKGLYQQLLRPLAVDVISIYDDVTKLLDTAKSDDLSETLTFLRSALEEALARNGIVDYSVDGDALDRTRQKVLELIETDDPSLDRMLAHRLRRGFELDGKVLRPEWVAVYRFEKSEASEKSEGLEGEETDDE